MNKKLLAFTTIPALGLSLLGMTAASAHGMGFGGMGMGMMSASLSPDDIATRQKTLFDSQAQLLGVSVDDVKAAWASGKSLAQLAKDKGISDADIQKRMADARTAQLNTQLKALVDKGIITQAQADQRLTFMKAQETNNNPKSKRNGRGMRRGMGMGFGF